MSSERVRQIGVVVKQPHGRFRQALESLYSAEPRVQPLGIASGGDSVRADRAVVGLSTSLLAHACLIFSLVRVPYLVRIFSGTRPPRTESHANQTVYVLRPLELSQYFPSLRPA